MKRKSLISKTLLQFVICATAVFMLSMPLFYLLTKYFYAEDMIDIIESVERGDGIPQLDLERDIMAGMMLQFLLIFLVISLSLFITMHFITRHLWQPFDDTLKKTDQFNIAHDCIPQFTETDILEFAHLNEALDRLMRKDRETFRIQKEFTENASHELQTPLAIIRSKLDLLIQEKLTKQQMQIASDLYELTMRMEHLNRNLLLLAKIDNAQYTACEEINIGSLISESLPVYSILQKDISLIVKDLRTDSKAMLHANAVLTECLLKNLIVNAIRHSTTNDPVEILIEDNTLTVSNTSSEGKSLDAATLFRRFRSGDVQQRGNGLGLAIVKAICDLHGWAVNYKFEEGYHLFIIDYHK